MNEPGYRYAPHIVDAFAVDLAAQMDDETFESTSGYVYRDDPRNFAQALMDMGYRRVAKLPITAAISGGWIAPMSSRWWQVWRRIRERPRKLGRRWRNVGYIEDNR